MGDSRLGVDDVADGVPGKLAWVSLVVCEVGGLGTCVGTPV